MRRCQVVAVSSRPKQRLLLCSPPLREAASSQSFTTNLCMSRAMTSFHVHRISCSLHTRHNRSALPLVDVHMFVGRLCVAQFTFGLRRSITARSRVQDAEGTCRCEFRLEPAGAKSHSAPTPTPTTSNPNPNSTGLLHSILLAAAFVPVQEELRDMLR